MFCFDLDQGAVVCLEPWALGKLPAGRAMWLLGRWGALSSMQGPCRLGQKHRRSHRCATGSLRVVRLQGGRCALSNPCLRDGGGVHAPRGTNTARRSDVAQA
jgi:hypothetical protein